MYTIHVDTEPGRVWTVGAVPVSQIVCLMRLAATVARSRETNMICDAKVADRLGASLAMCRHGQSDAWRLEVGA